MIRVIIVDTAQDFETKQQDLVELLGITCRYAGGFENPDIRLKNGKFAIPFPDKIEHQNKVTHLNWIEITTDEIIREEI